MEQARPPLCGCCAGLSKPTSGTGKVAGFDISTEPEEVKKNIGYMSQKFSLYEDLKVWENIRLFAGIYGMKDQGDSHQDQRIAGTFGLYERAQYLGQELTVGVEAKVGILRFYFPRTQNRLLGRTNGWGRILLPGVSSGN